MFLRMTVVRHHVFHVVLAICLVCGTLWVSHRASQGIDGQTEHHTTSVASTPEADVMDLRTGDTFWGFHLDGVLPCSSMLVKGGGNS